MSDTLGEQILNGLRDAIAYKQGSTTTGCRAHSRRLSSGAQGLEQMSIEVPKEVQDLAGKVVQVVDLVLANPTFRAREELAYLLTDRSAEELDSLIQMFNEDPDEQESHKGDSMKIVPFEDRVLVRREAPDETTASGLVLTPTAQKKQTKGTVVAIGPGRTLEDGSRGPMHVKEGDRILFGQYTGTEVEVGGETLVLMGQVDILAKFED